MAKDRNGNPLKSLAYLTKKTAKHAGVPRDVAAYIISSFIDVLADEIITTGGASIPGVVTFSSKKADESSANLSRYGLRRKYDVDLNVSPSRAIVSMHRMHTSFCKEGERIVTPSTWRDFVSRYGKTIRDNNFGSGVVEAYRVRKASSGVATMHDEDFIDVKEPVSVDYFKRLTEQMNKTGVYEVVYHKHSGESLSEGRDRILRLSDLTDETYEYIRKNKLERASALFDLKDAGKIKGEYLEPLGKSAILTGVRSGIAIK